MTVVIITHNSAITEMADRVVKVKSGTVSSVRINEICRNPSRRLNGDASEESMEERASGVSFGHTLGRFLAILAIVALGVGFFLGIKSNQERHDRHGGSILARK